MDEIVRTKVLKLVRLNSAVPEVICKRFGLATSTIEAFMEAYLAKGKRGRGRMQHAVDFALGQFHRQEALKYVHFVRPYSFG